MALPHPDRRSKYAGGWNEGMRQGQGILTLKNGKIFEAVFSNGIFGNGIYKFGNILDVPDNIWWLREVIKFGITILSMHTLHNVFKWRKYQK